MGDHVAAKRRKVKLLTSYQAQQSTFKEIKFHFLLSKNFEYFDIAGHYMCITKFGTLAVFNIDNDRRIPLLMTRPS